MMTWLVHGGRLLNLWIWKIRTMCVRQLAFIPAYIRGLEFTQPHDQRTFEGSWQEEEDTEERTLWLLGGSHCRSMGVRER